MNRHQPEWRLYRFGGVGLYWGVTLILTLTLTQQLALTRKRRLASVKGVSPSLLAISVSAPRATQAVT